MAMRKLSDVLGQAQSDRTAVGHFNIAGLVFLKAVVGAALERNVPVLVGASEGEREFMGTRQLAALVASLRDEFGVPIFLGGLAYHECGIENPHLLGIRPTAALAMVRLRLLRTHSASSTTMVRATSTDGAPLGTGLQPGEKDRPRLIVSPDRRFA